MNTDKNDQPGSSVSNPCSSVFICGVPTHRAAISRWPHRAAKPSGVE